MKQFVFLTLASVVIITNAASGGVIKVYETANGLANGLPADGILPFFPQGIGGVAGFVVLLETGDTGTPSRLMPNTWSDVLEFSLTVVNGKNFLSIQLTSPACGPPSLDEPQSQPCDPTNGGFTTNFITGVRTGNTVWLPEAEADDPTGGTLYDPNLIGADSLNQFLIFSLRDDNPNAPKPTGGIVFDFQSPPDGPTVPEPSAWLLLGSGLGAIVVLKKQSIPRARHR